MYVALCVPTVTPLMSMNVTVAGRPLNSGWLPNVTRTNGASFTHTGVIAVTVNAPTIVVGGVVGGGVVGGGVVGGGVVGGGVVGGGVVGGGVVGGSVVTVQFSGRVNVSGGVNQSKPSVHSPVTVNVTDPTLLPRVPAGNEMD